MFGIQRHNVALLFTEGKEVEIQIKGEGDHKRSVPMFLVLERN